LCSWMSRASTSPTSKRARCSLAGNEHVLACTDVSACDFPGSHSRQLRHPLFRGLARSHERASRHLGAGHARPLLPVATVRHVDGFVRGGSGSEQPARVPATLPSLGRAGRVYCRRACSGLTPRRRSFGSSVAPGPTALKTTKPFIRCRTVTR